MVGLTMFIVLVVIFVTTSRAQLTDIAGSTSVSFNPTDATCGGRTSADSYCRVDLVADAACAVETCLTVCANGSPMHLDLLNGIKLSGFDYDGSVTKSRKDLGRGYVTVAGFNKKTRLAFLKSVDNMQGLDDYSVTFWVKPNSMNNESSVIDLHGLKYGQRMLNIRLSSDLGITVVSGRRSITHQSWTIPRHAWTHVALQLFRSGVTIFLNGSDVVGTKAEISLEPGSFWSPIKVKIGQTFAGDLYQTHLVSEGPQIDRQFCRGRPNGWVDYTVAYVSVKCVDGDVSTVMDNRYLSSHKCYGLSVELPPNDADFCRKKVDGWYPQQTIGYTQCRDGRQLNQHTCGRGVNVTSTGTWHFEQCKFCVPSCSCEFVCSDDNAEERCGALDFECRHGEQKMHPEYCDEYYVCLRGKYKHRRCEYPDRWSIENRRCEQFHNVSCGERIAKYNPCDRDRVREEAEHACNTAMHPGNCTGRKDGLYYTRQGSCMLFGCVDSTVVVLEGVGILPTFAADEHRSTFFRCLVGGIDPATGNCVKGAGCPEDTLAYIADSPYLKCNNGDLRRSIYDSRNYWRCQNGLWTTEVCPESLIWAPDKKQCLQTTENCGFYFCPETIDTKERQFLGELADVRLYEKVLSESEINKLLRCDVWASDAHPIQHAVNRNSSTFWLSRTDLDSVDIQFDLQNILKLEEISMTFFGPVPLVVSIFKKVTTDDSWQLWRVFRDDCSDVLRCSQLGSDLKLDGEQLTYNLLEAKLGPLQRRTSAVRIRLSGHRLDGAAILRNISYFGFYGFEIYRRVSDICGIFGYVTREISSSCRPCGCDVRGVIDNNVECNEVGGQCACKQYVMGRRCDQCLSGYDNLQKDNPDGCSILTSTVTSPMVTTKVEQESPTTLNSEPSVSLPLYMSSAFVCVVIVVTTIIVVVCVRRRRQRDDTAQGTDAEVDSVYEEMPIVPNDEDYHDVAMASRDAGKVEMRSSGQIRKTAPDSDYLEPREAVYQRPVPAVLVPIRPQYAQLTGRQSDRNTTDADPDYFDIIDGTDGQSCGGDQHNVP